MQKIDGASSPPWGGDILPLQLENERDIQSQALSTLLFSNWRDTLFKVAVFFVFFRILENFQVGRFAEVGLQSALLWTFLYMRDSKRESEVKSVWKELTREIYKESEQLRRNLSSFSILLEEQAKLNKELDCLNKELDRLNKDHEKTNTHQEELNRTFSSWLETNTGKKR